MIHQEDRGQVSKTVSHYEILQKLGEGGIPPLRDPAGPAGNTVIMIYDR
ncbi:MAG: hypothetical protein V3U24_08595 [Candidatus Neomarinimicrobiota bacterium]